MAGPAVTALINWKKQFLKDKIKAIQDKIDANNAKIVNLQTKPDTQQQIESLEHINLGLEEDKKEYDDELSRFEHGSDGKKYQMAKRNIGNEIHRLQKEASENVAAAAAALAKSGPLIDISDKATEEVANN